MRLSQLAEQTGAELKGDGSVEIAGAATLEDAGPSDISFLANERYHRQLTTTRAAAVVLQPGHLDECPTNALIADNPYLVFAKVAALLYPMPPAVPGIDPSAVVAPSAAY